MIKKVTEIKDMEGLVNRMLVVSADSTVYNKIAAYIEQYYMQIIFMTAGELALQLSVSQGSVSKFCIALGYRGYADFLRNLQKFVGKEITAPERYHYTSVSTHHTDDVIEREIENLRTLKEITAGADYHRFAFCPYVSYPAALYALYAGQTAGQCATGNTGWQRLGLFSGKI